MADTTTSQNTLTGASAINDAIQSTNSQLLESIEKFKDPTSQLTSPETVFEVFILPALKNANKELNDYLAPLEEMAKTDPQAKEELKKWIDEQKKILTKFIKEQVNIMAREFSYIIANTPRLVSAISTVGVVSVAAVATVAATVPLLPAGPAAAAAQLAQFMPDIKSKISNLQQISDSLKVSSAKLIEAADKIYFPLPPMVNQYVVTLSTIDGLIAAIPIPK